jgi:hypothetical protein
LRIGPVNASRVRALPTIGAVRSGRGQARLSGAALEHRER